jgi:hypothetical protein
LPTVAAKPELATATRGGEQGLGRNSGSGSAHPSGVSAAAVKSRRRDGSGP